MNILSTFVVLLFTISLNSRQALFVETSKTINIEKPDVKKKFTVNHQDYTLYFELENTDNQNPSLIIGVVLHEGSHYISPYATRDFKGKFFMDLGNTENLEFKGAVIETPRSMEEYDSHPFVNGTVNWVRVNTTYKQPLLVKSQDDFQVYGSVRFTIEPRCTLEEIPFAISYENGVMVFIDSKC